MTAITPAATPTPIPAFAPLERFDEDEDKFEEGEDKFGEGEDIFEEGEDTFEEDGDEDEIAGTVRANVWLIWIASGVLQQAVLFKPQHQYVEVACPSQGVN
ncbi:hypothetical protein N7474_006678 [Penicillium riverlandense]|uniref:uncharacterized protein n=1 Tax=Penicillium riverlandense TaxID=1903569 RepID=UPI002549217C|nr:uncharacterized protein N7474_006678 [Penicillium riverlandense]KAJ5814901.1 hypothetical protein N7474_006678 [Penicillium riverlandense]